MSQFVTIQGSQVDEPWKSMSQYLREVLHYAPQLSNRELCDLLESDGFAVIDTSVAALATSIRRELGIIRARKTDV